MFVRWEQFTDNYAGPFSSTSNGVATTGTAYLTATDHVTMQSVVLSINTVF